MKRKKILCPHCSKKFSPLGIGNHKAMHVRHKMKQTGMFWHVHHAELLEYCYGHQERVDYIRRNKPADEIEIRLRLFQPVKGKLPETVIEACIAYREAGTAYGKAWAACDKAWAAYDKARAAYGKAWAACDKAWAAYDKAWAAYCEARTAYDKARAAHREAWLAYDKVIQDNMAEIKVLHERECPNCPWDGKQIVF